MWLLDQAYIDLVSWEMRFNRGYVDAIGITSHPRAKQKKISVIEVKRTRSDLLQDLRKQKMLKYERTASHCYLAATTDALAFPKKTKAEVLADLKARGLPVYWGVLMFCPDGKIEVIRGSRRKQPASSRSITMLIRKIARSWMYRVLSKDSPVSI
jgi:hypothetical protein